MLLYCLLLKDPSNMLCAFLIMLTLNKNTFTTTASVWRGGKREAAENLPHH